MIENIATVFVEAFFDTAHREAKDTIGARSKSMLQGKSDEERDMLVSRNWKYKDALSRLTFVTKSQTLHEIISVRSSGRE